MKFRTCLRCLIARCGYPVVACIAIACFSAAAFAQSAPTTDKSKPVAEVAGQPIYEGDFSPSVQMGLRHIHDEEYKLKKQAIEAMMSEKILENEAKKRNTTVEKLLETEVDSKVPDPTPDDVAAYYKDHQSQIGKSFDDVKLMLGPALKGMEVQRARQKYAKDLLVQAEADNEAVLLLHPPTVNVSVDPGRVRGNENAPVTIVEFADFGCPYCRQAESTISRVLTKYPQEVRFAYRDYPVTSLHPNAEIAAEASRCAADQGKYWQFHDFLFANPDKQSQAGLMQEADALHLDDKKFNACLASGQYKPQIQQDLQDGMRAGVRGTPAFFVNGVFLEGAQPLEAFDRLIKQDLAQSASGASDK